MLAHIPRERLSTSGILERTNEQTTCSDTVVWPWQLNYWVPNRVVEIWEGKWVNGVDSAIFGFFLALVSIWDLNLYLSTHLERGWVVLILQSRLIWVFCHTCKYNSTQQGSHASSHCVLGLASHDSNCSVPFRSIPFRSEGHQTSHPNIRTGRRNASFLSIVPSCYLSCFLTSSIPHHMSHPWHHQPAWYSTADKPFRKCASMACIHSIYTRPCLHTLQALENGPVLS